MLRFVTCVSIPRPNVFFGYILSFEKIPGTKRHERQQGARTVGEEVLSLFETVGLLHDRLPCSPCVLPKVRMLCSFRVSELCILSHPFEALVGVWLHHVFLVPFLYLVYLCGCSFIRDSTSNDDASFVKVDRHNNASNVLVFWLLLRARLHDGWYAGELHSIMCLVSCKHSTCHAVRHEMGEVA
jgi:hypothetical protein